MLKTNLIAQPASYKYIKTLRKTYRFTDLTFKVVLETCFLDRI